MGRIAGRLGPPDRRSFPSRVVRAAPPGQGRTDLSTITTRRGPDLGTTSTARNTLTHRIQGPTSTGTIELDYSAMRDGDRAGLAMPRDTSAWTGVKRDDGAIRVVMANGLTMGTDNLQQRVVAQQFHREVQALQQQPRREAVTYVPSPRRTSSTRADFAIAIGACPRRDPRVPLERATRARP